MRGMYTAPEVLDRHLTFLERCGFTTCDFSDLSRALRGERALPKRPVLLTFDDGHLDNYTEGLPVLQAHGAKATVFVVVGDVGARGVVWPDASETTPTDLFDWDQAARLQRSGVRIEAHGLGHSRMDALPPEELERQLAECRRVIHERLGHESLAMAYPFGVWNRDCAAAARGAGFEFACTTHSGMANLERDELLALPRLSVRGYRWVHELQFRLAVMKARARQR